MRGVGSMAEMLACGEVTAVRFPLVLADIVIAGLDVFFFRMKCVILRRCMHVEKCSEMTTTAPGVLMPPI